MCKDDQYQWEKRKRAPESLGDYYINFSEDQQSMNQAIDQWVQRLRQGG